MSRKRREVEMETEKLKSRLLLAKQQKIRAEQTNQQIVHEKTTMGKELVEYKITIRKLEIDNEILGKREKKIQTKEKLNRGKEEREREKKKGKGERKHN